MKNLLMILPIFLTLSGFGQKKITAAYKVTPGKKIVFKFDYPQIIRISTWDKDEVQVQGEVNINDGIDNDAFILEENTNANSIIISNKIREMATLQRYYVLQKNGNKGKVFATKEAFEKYNQENGGKLRYNVSSEVYITLDIKIPAGIDTKVEAIYGMVELVNVDNSITVDATYGGIDATLSENNIGQLSVTAEYGTIYSNLNLPITSKKRGDFYTSITSDFGKGNAYKFASTYGKIYIRKPGN